MSAEREATRDTLCGVATGVADGGVAIVRISGPRARTIAESLLEGALPRARRLGARALRLPGGQRERALVVHMPGPRSFTGEDVVELHVHGGERNVRSVLEAVVGAGARAAGPGEFSRRAFDNGVLDLTRAEGIAAVIGAQTEAGLAQARRLAAGELGDEVERMVADLFELRTEVEAHLDFPEDVGGDDRDGWRGRARELRSRLEGWLGGFEAGRRARERIRVVLVGPPNAGKSALFNALLGRDRAIVASEPGTTRDYLEEALAVGAYEVTLVDTAGRRATTEGVERAGVERAAAQAVSADVVLWVVGSDQEDEEEIETPDAGLVLRVESKRDLGARRRERLGVSARSGEGIVALLGRVRAWLEGDGASSWIGLARHRERAAEAVEALRDAEERIGDGQALELAVFQLGVAEDRIGEIIGRTRMGPVGDAVLEAIFSRFCIGK